MAKIVTAKKMLERINTFLGDHKISDDERQKLYDVLCATRGPDNEDEAVKSCTTEVIRHFAIPACVAWAFCSSDRQEKADARQMLPQKNHFKQHAVMAFEALGLDWGAENKKEEKA